MTSGQWGIGHLRSILVVIRRERRSSPSAVPGALKSAKLISVGIEAELWEHSAFFPRGHVCIDVLFRRVSEGSSGCSLQCRRAQEWVALSQLAV